MKRRLCFGMAALVVAITMAFPMMGRTAEAAAAWETSPIYLVKFQGTASGFPIRDRFGLLLVVPGQPSVPGLRGPNPLDICFAHGNPFALQPAPGSIQLETRTKLCPLDSSTGLPTQLATVTANPSTGVVSALFRNLGGGSNVFGGLNCSATAGGSNPNVFIGGNPSELGLTREAITVCDGFMNLTFKVGGSVTGRVTVWRNSLGGFGSTTRFYDVNIICGKALLPGAPVVAPC